MAAGDEVKTATVAVIQGDIEFTGDEDNLTIVAEDMGDIFQVSITSSGEQTISLVLNHNQASVLVTRIVDAIEGASLDD